MTVMSASCSSALWWDSVWYECCEVQLTARDGDALGSGVGLAGVVGRELRAARVPNDWFHASRTESAGLSGGTSGAAGGTVAGAGAEEDAACCVSCIRGS